MLFHYVYLAFFCLVAVTFFDERVVVRSQQLRFFQFLSVCFVIQITILYVFRDMHSDTWRYVQRFNGYPDMSLAMAVVQSGKEVGFTFISWATAQLGLGHRAYLFVVFIIGLIPFVAGLKRVYGNGWGFMLLAYSMFPFFVSYFASGLRQAISMALGFLFVVSYFEHRRLFRFILGISVAGLFHVSSFVLLPVVLALHFFERQLILSRVLLIWLAVAVISMLGLNESMLGFLSGFFDESSKYQYYLDQDKISQIQQQIKFN